MRFEHLDHADVGEAACRTAAEGRPIFGFWACGAGAGVGLLPKPAQPDRAIRLAARTRRVENWRRVEWNTMLGNGSSRGREILSRHPGTAA